ncbi:MAG: hypothetical protein ACI9EF_002866 [Pseudohongiellaceae bacterium]|jgi:hypothetical protein
MGQSTAPFQTEDTRRQPGVFQKLGSLFRTYAIPEDSIVLPGPFDQDDRSCFSIEVPEDWPSDADGRSKTRLLEDGQYLGPASVTHDDIRTLGRGRYSHWGPKVYFSASDNSDPNTNGRTYSIVPPKGWSPPTGASGWADYASRRSDDDRVFTMEWATEELAASTMKSVSGPLFSVELRENWPSDDESLSTVLLFENDTPLLNPHSSREDITSAGSNAYGHWGNALFFATSDGSDPTTNGRTYSVAYATGFTFDQARKAPWHESGECWILDGLPAEWPSDKDGPSNLRLLEDGVLLGPAHAGHGDLREHGEGRYCHWGDQLWFSASDNSDPTTNGRTYTVVWIDQKSDGTNES